MPTMMIRGGDLDLVEYEFEPFAAGEQIRPLDIGRETTLRPQEGAVTVRAPARIHATVLDMNRFAPGQPGGGGFGFAVKVYCTATAECTDGDVEIDYDRVPIVRHIVEAFRATVGYRGGFRIAARDHQYKHVGLGSTGTILLAVCHAMNAAVGSPLTAEELRILVGRNFVEDRTAVVLGDAFSPPFAPGLLFDRAIVPTPYGMDRILDTVTPLVRNGGAVHFYTFKKPHQIEGLKQAYEDAGYHVIRCRRCGNVAPAVSRWVFDLEKA